MFTYFYIFKIQISTQADSNNFKKTENNNLRGKNFATN